MMLGGFSLSPKHVDFNVVWNGLSNGILKILTLQTAKGMPLVEDVYSLCTATPQSHAEKLYVHLRQLLENHVDKLRESILESRSDLLISYHKQWDIYSTGAMFVDACFRYLNGNWIKRRIDEARNKVASLNSPNSLEVHEVLPLALITWKERLFLPVRTRLLNALLELIKLDRDGEQINQTLVAGVIQSYVKLGRINVTKPLELYNQEFETPFLQATNDYYSRESSLYLAAHGISAYMLKAEQRLEEEQNRAKKYLDMSSRDKITRECEAVLIEKHRDKMQEECETMFREDRQPDLTRMFHLLSRINGIKPMLDVLEKYVTEYGMEKVKSIPDASMKDPQHYVETLLAVYNKFSLLVKRAFKNCPQFVVSVDKACRRIVNENPVNSRNSNKSPEMLAKFCDILLKKGQKNLEERELEQKLGQVIIIFKYVDDKDVFQKFYSKMLAKRLIQGSSVSSDAESLMITGLKQACGYEYTSKLQRMFTDMTLSTDIQDKFKDYISTSQIDLGKVDFSILVLTAGSWPLQTQTTSVNVDPELEKCIEAFQAFYNKQHHGRKLNWLHHLSKGELKVLYLKRRYEVQVTSYQMSVLLLFNKFESLTVDDVTKTTGLKDTELHRIIQSLMTSKLLLKSPPEEAAVKETDVLSLNKDFVSKRLKLKISAPLQQETPKEAEDTHKTIEEDRKLYLQAAIVRIMKSRRVLQHNILIQEVIDQAKSRFQPHVPMIKKCIEHLIEKEYLKRVEGSTNQYSYIA